MKFNIVTRALGKIGRSFLSHSPDIMLGGGIVLIGAGVFLACKKTLELEPITNAHIMAVNEIKSELKPETYTKKMQDADMTAETFHFVGCLIRHYALPILLLGGGIGLVVGSHIIMAHRLKTLAAAYMALNAAYMAEKNANYKIEKDEETGKTYVVKEPSLEYADKDHKGRIIPGPYAAWYDVDCICWDRHDAAITLERVLECEREMNHKLDRWGVVYLNEALQYLGIPRTDVGQVCGWYKKDPKHRIEFAPPWMLNCMSQEFMDFTKGNKGAPTVDELLLDFNCDGPLLGLTPREDVDYANTLRSIDKMAAQWAPKRRVLEVDFGSDAKSLADYEAMIQAEMEAANEVSSA